MNLQVKRFLEELSENTEFRKKFEEASNDEKNRLASFYLEGMSLDKFKEEISTVREKYKSGSKSIESKKLSAVAGGGDFGKGIGSWLGERFDEFLKIKEKDDEKGVGFKDIGKTFGDIVGDSICNFLKF